MKKYSDKRDASEPPEPERECGSSFLEIFLLFRSDIVSRQDETGDHEPLQILGMSPLSSMRIVFSVSPAKPPPARPNLCSKRKGNASTENEKRKPFLVVRAGASLGIVLA